MGCVGPGTYQKSAPLSPSAGSAQFTVDPDMPLIYRPVELRGIYHTVAPKETLYRISQTYGVTIEAIMKANRIKDPTKIRKGQPLFIPDVDLGPMGEQPSIPLFANRGRWKYIVIHHTATKTGNMDFIDKAHKNRGFGEMGYHFLIDNGTMGKSTGQIEVGHRWTEQKDGAHARADNMNMKGIGVSLIGNFSEDTVSDEQLRSLVYVVNTLRYHYKIPKWRIIGHRDVRGAATECPGSHFPMGRFKRMLDSSTDSSTRA